ncbi:hypothetical protein [Arcicella rigui]|uniref:DUF302 domain-containing protein n=1 Tax=Arcicella rigui TaxID=797020 RepID=A0ABU5QCQ9_9BACT|nr:hypothetical protein [Arcicella rigui]MEA5140139.1 hypothetical protein [Arcicella rigui]
MKTIEDLWPEDLVRMDIPSPKEILIEQANYLTERTKNLLVGEVKTSAVMIKNEGENYINHEFIIKAPFMGNYQFVLLKVAHKLSIYPLTITDELNEESFVIYDEGEFKRTLAQILRSKLVKDAINSLVGRIGYSSI